MFYPISPFNHGEHKKVELHTGPVATVTLAFRSCCHSNASFYNCLCFHLYWDLNFRQCPSIFPCRTPPSTSCSAGLAGSQPTSFRLSENVFISPSLLKDSFAGYRILGCWGFFFQLFEYIDLWPVKFLRRSLLTVFLRTHFSLAASQSLPVRLAEACRWCLGVGLFEFIFLGVQWASLTFIVMRLIKFGKFSTTSSNILSASCSLSSPFETLTCLCWSLRSVRFCLLSFNLFSVCFEDSVTSTDLSSNLLILSSHRLISAFQPRQWIFHFSYLRFQLQHFFLSFFFFRFSVSLLIFPLCSYIIFLTFSTSSFSSLNIFKTVF